MVELLHSPGFLGTRANWAADVTLLVMLGVGILWSVGFYLARQDNIKAHKWVQTTGAVINLILVLWLMVLPFRDFVLQNKGGPRDSIFYIVTGLHALVGLSAIGFGWYVVLRGHKLLPKAISFNNYKPFMRAAYGLYMGTILLGVLVYLTWFIIIPASQLPVY